MNRVIAEYWFYFVILLINLCIFGTISVKAFMTGKEKKEDSVFAKENSFKLGKFLVDYGLTIVLAIYFLIHVLDLPFVLTKNYRVKEGIITHVYKTSIDIDGGESYTTITAGLNEEDKVKIFYLPFTKRAPIVEVEDY